jgi:hypothetical protein
MGNEGTFTDNALVAFEKGGGLSGINFSVAGIFSQEESSVSLESLPSTMLAKLPMLIDLRKISGLLESFESFSSTSEKNTDVSLPKSSLGPMTVQIT